MNEWAWEMGSQCSVPSAWSKPSTVHSSVSKLSSATGEGLIPGLVDGQRLSTVKPAWVPTTGGKVVVSLHKEVPQGFWDRRELSAARHEAARPRLGHLPSQRPCAEAARAPCSYWVLTLRQPAIDPLRAAQRSKKLHMLVK